MFFVTAGHILKNLQEAFDHPQIEVTAVYLADSFGHQSKGKPPIIFDFKRANKYFIDDDEKGLDYGLIALTGWYLSQLAANNVVVIRSEILAALDEEFDRYVIVGLPSEFTEWDLVHGVVSPTVLGVKRTSVPSHRSSKKNAQFIGQLNQEFGLDSVDGMSGGLVLGLRIRGDEARYWPLAIQSSWNRTERLVFACPIRDFAEQIAIEIDKVNTELYQTRPRLSQD